MSIDQSAAVRRLNRFVQTAREFASDPVALTAAVVLVILAIMSLTASLIATQNPYDLSQLDLMDSSLPPGSMGYLGTYFPLGTDDQGRDMYSAMLYGLRTSLFVGLISTALALVVGVTLGMIAAYFEGWISTIIMRLADFQLSLPAILLAMILLVTLGEGSLKIILALAAVQWAYYARTIRAAALVEKEKEYVKALRTAGVGDMAIIFRHLLANSMPPVLVVATLQVANAISLEATLSFLGIGLPVTEPSLGLLISSGFTYLLSGQYWLSIFPGLLLLIVILSVNLVGDRLRELFDPKRRK